MGVVSVENEQPVPIADVANRRLRFKVAPEPGIAKFLIRPPFWGDGDAAIYMSDGVSQNTKTYLALQGLSLKVPPFALEDDAGVES
jgi:hypothetical protein